MCTFKNPLDIIKITKYKKLCSKIPYHKFFMEFSNFERFFYKYKILIKYL